MDDVQKTAGDDPDAIVIEGVESIRIPVAAHLETVIRCKRASFVVQNGDGRTEVVIRNAVIRIEGDPGTGTSP
jgi:hypothetical protein